MNAINSTLGENKQKLNSPFLQQQTVNTNQLTKIYHKNDRVKPNKQDQTDILNSSRTKLSAITTKNKTYTNSQASQS